MVRNLAEILRLTLHHVWSGPPTTVVVGGPPHFMTPSDTLRWRHNVLIRIDAITIDPALTLVNPPISMGGRILS